MLAFSIGFDSGCLKGEDMPRVAASNRGIPACMAQRDDLGLGIGTEQPRSPLQPVGGDLHCPQGPSPVKGFFALQV